MMVTRTEIEKIRMNFIKDMNNYILNTLQPDLITKWKDTFFYGGNMIEEDLNFYATHDNAWQYMCDEFNKMTKEECS